MNDLTAFPPVLDLLPHRPPMLLLRRVLRHSPAETQCEGWIEPGFAGGAPSAAFALELIAQAAAVHHGLADPGAERATRGLLLGSRRLHLRRRDLPAGQPLRVIVTGRDEPAGGLIRFEGRVEDEAGTVLASGDATVLETGPDIAVA